MRVLRPVGLALALTAGIPLMAAAPASAQTGSTQRSVTVQTGKNQRVAVVPNLTRDCKMQGPAMIRVVTPPKNGTLIAEAGRARTPANYRCPNAEAVVQALFYRANGTYKGPDEIVVQTKLPDQSPETITIRITVSDKAPEKPGDKPAEKPADKSGLTDILDL